MSNEVTSTITVSRDALYKVLHALVGPAHHIRELQATRSLHALGHPNPIDILIEEYKAGAPTTPAAPAAVAGPVAYRVLRKRHDGEWVTDGRAWCDGVPTQDLVDDIALRSDGWRIEYAFAAPTTPAAPQQEPAPWVPYLSDRADGCSGHYAIARHNPAGYREVWNVRLHKWASASDEVLSLEQASELMRKLVMPTAPAAVAWPSEFPHEQMDAMALARYKVVPSTSSMFWSHAVVAGDGAQQLYVGREVECQNMVRKFAGAFLDGAFAFHSIAAAPTAQAAPDDSDIYELYTHRSRRANKPKEDGV